MKPSELSTSLCKIASKIDSSSNPSRKLVARDLKRVLSAVLGQSTFDPNAYYGPGQTVEQYWKDQCLDEAEAVGYVDASNIVYMAMRAIGLKNWSPSVGLKPVLDKALELAAQYGVSPSRVKARAESNWETFVSSILPKIEAGEKL